MVKLESTITCPACGFQSAEAMPTDACQYFYACKGCGLVLKPKEGDCCVFCSYGDVPCPPVQEEAQREWKALLLQRRAHRLMPGAERAHAAVMARLDRDLIGPSMEGSVLSMALGWQAQT